MNNVILVGRITSFEGNGVTISITRNYKNEDGIYMSDLIPIWLSANIGEKMKDFCKIGDVIGVKGRLENRGKVVVMADKVSFISAKKSE